MREHCAAASGPAPWPGIPRGGSAPARGQARSTQADIAEVTLAIGRTRWLFLVSGGLLAADIAVAAATALALLSHGGAVAAVSVGLLLPVMLSWLVAAALLLWAERPVADAVGELRWVTGAPVDFSVPCSPLDAGQSSAPEPTWPHVVRLIGAVAVRQGRARLALSSAILATAGFLAWLVLSLTIAAII
jgi:hypothetical protein